MKLALTALLAPSNALTCVAAPPGFDQPEIYEPIETEMAEPAGRGPGGPKHDLFALGMTAVAMLLGFNETGINLAASLHFVAALPNSHYFEYCVEQGALRQTLTKQRFPVVDGEIAVPEEPGLGVELYGKVVEKFRVK